MNPTRYQQLKTILIPAMGLNGDELTHFLDEQCGNDSLMRQEIESLLALNVGDTFLAQSPVKLEGDPELEGKLGRIKIDRLLARGGMGEVYAGTDELLGRPVAIKILTSGLRLSAARRTGFLNEAKLLSSLQHPNICQVYDFFEDQERDVIVLELIEGQTLRQLLQSESINQPNLLALQLAKALIAAHERGISHHDLKPENIMVDSENTLKVLDFGLAKNDHSKDAMINQIVGTPAYMAPEQAQGRTSGQAADIYAMGLILAELWTGSAVQTAQGLEPKLALKPIQQLPKSERNLLVSMLETDPVFRPSARAVWEQINHINDRSRRRLKWSVAAGLVIISAVFLWKYTTDLQHERNLAIAAKDEALLARNDAEGLIAFMLNDLQSGLRAIGKLNLLESVADQAMSYYGELDAERMQATRGQPAVALAQVAEVFDYQGDKEQAISAYQTAANALTTLHQNNPNDDLVQYHLANTLVYLGQNFKLNGNFEQAKTTLNTAIEHANFLTQNLEPGLGPDEAPSATERWGVLLNAHYNHGDVYMRQGDGQKAVNVLESFADTARLAAKNNAALNRYLADIEFKLCDTYFDIPLPDKVIEPCAATMKMDLALHEKEPENYRLHANYTQSTQVLGRSYAMIGEHEQALKYLNLSIQEARKLHAWEPEDAARKNDLVLALLSKGRYLYDQAQFETARELLEEAEALVMTLITDKKEITVRNNAFAIKLLLGKTDEARPFAAELHQMGFRRREFGELCEQFDIAECLD